MLPSTVAGRQMTPYGGQKAAGATIWSRRSCRFSSEIFAIQPHFSGMNVGIVLDPPRANFNGGANGAVTYYWGGVHGPSSRSIPPITSSWLECSSSKTGVIR
jgi:hypothetical protein